MVGLAASDYGALFVVFRSPAEREEAMARFPLSVDGHCIRLERPEDGCNRFAWKFSTFAHITATGFPLEHWDERGIWTAFRSIGHVCCIDQLCLNEMDFSAVRLVMKLESASDVPAALLVCNALGTSSAVVDLRVVHAWRCDEDGRAEGCIHYGCPLCDSDAQGMDERPLPSRMSDIDDDTIRGYSPPPPVSRPPSSSVLSLWGRIVARRQDDFARAAALATIDGLPADTDTPMPSAHLAKPSELWDRVLARRMATQFPEARLDASQWYDTLQVPATPLQPEHMEAGEEAQLSATLDDYPVDLPAEAAFDTEHEDAARKQRVRRKRATDSAFKARRSARLAEKEAPQFISILSKAKAVKASRYDLSGGSPVLRAAATAASFGGLSDPGPIPLPRLKELAVACGVDPDAVTDAMAVPSSSA